MSRGSGRALGALFALRRGSQVERLLTAAPSRAIPSPVPSLVHSLRINRLKGGVTAESGLFEVRVSEQWTHLGFRWSERTGRAEKTHSAVGRALLTLCLCG